MLWERLGKIQAWAGTMFLLFLDLFTFHTWNIWIYKRTTGSSKEGRTGSLIRELLFLHWWQYHVVRSFLPHLEDFPLWPSGHPWKHETFWESCWTFSPTSSLCLCYLNFPHLVEEYSDASCSCAFSNQNWTCQQTHTGHMRKLFLQKFLNHWLNLN